MGYDAWVAFLLTIIISVVCQVACLIVMHRVFDYNVKEYIKKIIIPCSLVTLLLPLPLYMVHEVLDGAWARLIVESFASVLVTVLLLFMLVFSKAEKNMVIFYVRKVLKRA